MPLALILDNYLGYIKKLFGDVASIHYDSGHILLVSWARPSCYPLTFIID